MNRRLGTLGVVVAAAGAAVLVGVVTALGSRPVPETATPGLAGTVGLLLGVVALLAVVVRARGDPGPDAAPAPWTDDGQLLDRPPEETPDEVAVSGTETAETLAVATRTARSAGDVTAGVDRIRPPLRQALGSALVAGGHDPDAVECALAEGTWTDDGLAAAVLDEAVDPPRRTLRERFHDWLSPERAVRERTRRAVAAVDEAADEALPAVVGEDAPRTVPVVAPTLEDLQRTADGRLQRAEAVGDGRRRHERASGDGPGPSVPGPDDADEGSRSHGRVRANGASATIVGNEDSAGANDDDSAGRTKDGHSASEPASAWGDVSGGQR